MQRSGKIKLADLNSLLTCILCGGYYIDATTIIECLHSFCRTCIVKYLHTNKYCPTCDVQVHKTKPLDNIRSDQTLQDIVYKLVPGLFKNEMKRRRDFYSQKNEAVKRDVPMSSEKRGDVLGGERLIFTPEDVISISLEYCPPYLPFPSPLPQHNEDSSNNPVLCDILPKAMCHRRYLRCPGAIKVAHLKKFLQAKYNLLPRHNIDVMYMHDYLRDEYTLIDLAYIYSWRRNAPLRLFYKIHDIFQRKTREKVVVKEVPFSYPASQEAASPHVNVILKHANSAHAPSVAAAPSSQVYFQSHPSPPPSPQMATEPDHLGNSKHNCAALPNGQVKMGATEMMDKHPKNGDIHPERKSVPFLDKPKLNISLNSDIHPNERHRKRDTKLVRKNRSYPDSVSDKMNGVYKDRRGSVSKRFASRKAS